MKRIALLGVILLLAVGAQAQRSYQSVSIATILNNNPAYWTTISTYVSVGGYLAQKSSQSDGDILFVICETTGFTSMDRNHCINGEIVPYLKCDGLPGVGTWVTIKGMVHYDGGQHWWEVHPIEGINGLSCYVKGHPTGT